MNEIQEGQFYRGSVPGVAALEPGGQMPTQAHSMVPRFFTQPVRVPDGKDSFKYIDVEYIEILLAGDMKSAPVQKVSDNHRRMYREAYEAFKRGEELAATGTPLELWPVFTSRPAAVQALKMHNIYTVEALAGITDNALAQLHNAAFGSIGFEPRALRDMAAAFIEARKTSEPQERLAAENRELRDSMTRLEEMVARLQGQLTQKATTAPADPNIVSTPDSPAKRGPGRPTKAKE